MRIDQIAIAVLGVSAAFMSQSPNVQARRWAPMLGLSSQPFWFYSSFVAEQWGIFALCFFYTAAWIRGVRTYWLTGDK